MDLEVRDTRNGKGIFARRPLTRNEHIFEVTGRRMSLLESNHADGKTKANSYRLDARTYISPDGSIGDFLNHSCDPNAAVKKEEDRLFVYAAKEIAPGDEVVIDYSTIMANDDAWEMDCNCGFVRCRGKVLKFASLPAEVQEKYLSEGLVPNYILAIP